MHLIFFVPSRAGNRYDNCSRKVLIYFLKKKSEVFNTFKIWKAKVETETSLKVKCLRFDNGGEYIDRDSRNIVLSIVLGWRRQFLEHHSRMVLHNI